MPNEELQKKLDEITKRMKEQEELHADVKKASFPGRWITSGILPIFTSVVLFASTWMYNHNIEKEYNDAHEDTKKTKQKR